MPQEAVVRDIVTDELTDAKDADLIRRAGARGAQEDDPQEDPQGDRRAR